MDLINSLTLNPIAFFILIKKFLGHALALWEMIVDHIQTVHHLPLKGSR